MSMYFEVPFSGTGIEGAKQAHKDECDINLILARHKAGAGVQHVNQHEGRFSDVSQIGDYRTAIERVRETNKFFMGLSAEQRSAFDNDAAIFLDAVQDPDQLPLLQKLGLEPLVEVPVPVVDPPVVVPEVPPEPAEPAA